METVYLDRRSEDINFEHMFAESMYQLKLLENEAVLHRKINELLCAESGNAEGLELIQEGVLEKVKNSLLKVWNGIVKMWNTFVHKMEEVVGAQKVFLENNKDVILRKPPRKVNIETYKYNLALLKYTATKYDGKTIMQLEDEEKLRQDFLNDSILQDKSDYEDASISDMYKAIVRGSNSPIQMLATDLNMTDLYNYCYDFKAIKSNIKENLAKLEETKEAVLSTVKVASSEYERENGKNDENDSSINHQDDGDNNTNSNSSNNNNNQPEPKKTKAQELNDRVEKGAKGESAIEEFIGNAKLFLNEFKVSGDSTSASTGTSSNSKSLANNMRKVANQEDPKDSKVKNDVKGQLYNGIDLDEIEKKVRIYYKFYGDILSAQLNISFEIFTEYMKILRWHVDGFTSKEKEVKDGVAKSGTNFKKDAPEVKEEKIED